MDINQIGELVAALVGFPALVAALINVAKSFGWLADGSAGKVNLMAHLVAYVGVGVAVLFGKVDILPGLDLQLGNIANSLLILLAFLSSIGVAKKFHAGVLRGLPVVGFSHP
jgi:hypothetical protein